MSAVTLPFERADGVDGAAQLNAVMPCLAAAIASVRAADLEQPTPCAAWSVRDLLNHVIGGAEMFAAAFGGAPLRDISGRLPDVVGDDAMPAFERAAGAFGGALAGPGVMARVLPLPFGPMTVATFLRFAAFDLVVHSWDLASVTGAPIELPDDLLVEIEAFARGVLEAVPRTELFCADEVPVGEDATPLQRLVALSGRRP